MKKLVAFILSGVCLTAAIAGVIVYANFKDKVVLSKVTNISVNSETTKKLEVNLNDFEPGKESSYSILIKSKDVSVFDFSLSFYQEDKTGSLADYLSLEIVCNDFTYTNSLAKVLNDQETIQLGNNVKEINLKYKMEKEVGNEAQDAYVNFYIDLMAKAND